MFTFDEVPSIDGLGVRRWTWQFDDGRTLQVYERPSEYADTPFMLRLTDPEGRHVDTRHANSREEVIEAACEMVGELWRGPEP